jgi:glycosyltransferase involved in cell wall biosynthesis
MPSSLPLVVHLIPKDVIGGVEVAANSLPSGPHPYLFIKKYFLARNCNSLALGFGEYEGRHSSPSDPRNFIQSIRWLRTQHPHLLIASLWRCHLVMILYKLINHRCKSVSFIHSSSPVHVLDCLITLASMAVASEIWVDSIATMNSRVPHKWHSKVRAVSFLLEKRIAVASELPRPSFVFWGRLAYPKNLDRAIRTFKAVQQSFPSAKFQIIGPDGGRLDCLQRLVQDLSLSGNVQFLGARGHDEIELFAKRSSFYLQTSLFEGMAMSVIEAMQLGLVPVVTHVGEIASYCKDGHNSLIATDPESTALRILDILGAPIRYRALQEQAIATWSKTPLYRDEFIGRSLRLLNASKPT